MAIGGFCYSRSSWRAPLGGGLAQPHLVGPLALVGFIGVAILYLSLKAEFVAAVQVLFMRAAFLCCISSVSCSRITRPCA